MPLRRLIWAAGVLVVLFALAGLFWPRLDWVGGAPVRLSITTVDSVTGSPVAGADVSCRSAMDLGTPRPPNYPVFITDSAGHVDAAWLFGAGGTKYPPFRTGSVSFAGHVFIVQAPGYERLICNVADYTGASRSLWASRRLPAITLKLVPIAATAPG